MLPWYSEQTIADVWSILKYHEDNKLPMPPTSCFKAASLVVFALMAEIFSIILPKHIKISIQKAFQTYQFNEFYCLCGCVCGQEQSFFYHVRAMHLPVIKFYSFMKHSHVAVDQVELDDLIDPDRSDLLGSIEE